MGVRLSKKCLTNRPGNQQTKAQSLTLTHSVTFDKSLHHSISFGLSVFGGRECSLLSAH